MFTRNQIKTKLAICAGSIKNLPNFPNKIEAPFFGNLALYRPEEVNEWFINRINQRENSKTYSGDIGQERIIKIEELSSYLKISKTHIYVQIKSGQLPALVKIGKRSSGFILSEINQKLLECGIAPMK
ncbi:helix-turn-helix transcriptional regulator [Vibrio campbellii]